jgi:homoserine dehydrogenase
MKLRVAEIGMGGISGAHVPAWNRMEDVELVAICDIRPERLDHYDGRTAARTYTDFDEMLEHEEFDILDITLPTYLHADYAVKALERGIHVVTEKPISEKQYLHYLMEYDEQLHSVRKKKHRFIYRDCRFELDVYPFSSDRAVLFMYGEDAEIPPEITVLREVTGDPAYKNRQLARVQTL